jgi:glycosyltransferase involved in cell wall biosynthesis
VQPHVAVVCTNTFYAPRIAERLSRDTPVVHWVFDLFPDVLVVGGNLRAGSIATRLLDRLTRSTFDRAAANVFLGERLLAHAVARFGPIPRSVVIPVGCDARPFAGTRPEGRAVGEPVRVLYCGNLGRMHDVDTVVGALRVGLPEALEFSFRGSGNGFRLLEDAVRDQQCLGRVAIGGSLKEADWINAMRTADVALVTMKPGAEGVVMPSKTYSALAAGQAVVAVCPGASDLADTIRTHDCGWVVEPGDVSRLSSLFEEIVTRPEELLRRRQNAWRAGQQVFDQRALAGVWNSVFAAALEFKRSPNDETCV